MDDFKPDLLKALLDWVNTFEFPGRVNAWGQLEDGQVLWQILSDIDADYFSESLPNFDESHRRTSDNWISKWQNLKHIERAVSTYIREECEQLPALTKRMMPDLKTGARDGSTMLTAKLTMAVLLASLYSPRSNQRMIQVMSKLGTKTAETIAEAIQEMQALDSRMAQLGVDQELTPELNLSGYRTPTRTVSGATSAMDRDSGLEQEAQLFEANKDRGALRTQVSKLQEELGKTRSRISQLEEELVEAKLHLDDRGQRASSDDIEQLRNELTRDRQYIDQLETDLANSRDILESQKRRLERLSGEEGSKQDLRDQLQLIRAERDELSQKAKANENLKKKIQSLTQETKNLETLRQDYQQARERLQELETVEERCQALEMVNKENSQTLVNCEQSIFEEKSKRTRIEHENLLLMKQLEQLRELQYKAEDAKAELEDRIRELESSSHATRGDSLEDELTQDEHADKGDEPASARSTMDGRISSDAIALQQKVDILAARLKSLETETLKQMQENLGLRSDMTASRDEDSQRPFLEQNQKLQATETELEELHRRLREKDLQMAELRNELNKKSDMDEDAKAEGLQAEHERLLTLQQNTNERLRDLEISNDEKSSLLRAALLDRNNLNPNLLELKKVETLRLIREQIEGVIKAPSEAQPTVLDTTSSEIADTVLASQAALDIAKKDLQDRETSILDLRGQLDKAKNETTEKGSIELQQEVENLRRENRLITSAWYDMTTRLQSNTVMLQRKSEAPKSWLGKQRAVVGGNASSTRR